MTAGCILWQFCVASCAGAFTRHLPLGMQVNQLLELQDEAAGTQKYEAIQKWTTHVNALHNTIVSRLQ